MLLILLFVVAIIHAARMVSDPIDWAAKPLDLHGDLFGNADACEASDKQVALDRRSAQHSRKAMHRLVSHNLLCTMNAAETKRWLRELAAKNDENAKHLLRDLADWNGG
jgi:hypothetical protein